MRFAITYFVGLIFGGLADIEKRFLKTFDHRGAIYMNQVVRTILYPLWLKIFIYDLHCKTAGFALVFSTDNLIKYVIYFAYVRSSKTLQKHLIPLNLEYFERTGVKIDQSKAAIYSICQKTIS